MARRQAAAPARRALAAVEFAIVAPILFGLLLGGWEIGRLVQVQQIISTAAREGGRVAAQGFTINSNNTSQQITVSSTNPADLTVERTVKDCLRQSGIDPTHAVVTFTYVSGDTTLTQPYQATKGQLYRVDVTVPYNDFRWVSLDLTNTVNLKGSTVWASLADDPFTLNTTIPQ
jgi:Flp pilus assembly protein TadG